MQKIGILIEFKNDRIKKTNFGAITLARREKGELFAIVLNGKGAAFREQLQEYGIEKIIDISSKEGPISWNPIAWAKAVIDAMDHFDITILFGLTSAVGKDILPRVAARLDAPLVMDCLDIHLSERTVKKTQFSGKTIATIRVNGRHGIYGIRLNAVDPKPAPCKAEVIPFQTSAQHLSLSLTVEGITESTLGGIDLSEADVIISGGRGMGKSENFDILFECADVIKAAVGASRAAVDAGWAPHSMQVGQTGATVSPKVYIACGISGSVQHFAGMKTSGIIIAVNTDPEASITKNCDYYIVADLFEILPILTKEMKALVHENRIMGKNSDEYLSHH